MIQRCEWCGTDPLYVAYHDGEWGVPAHDDRHLFEMLILEGAQAGLSWLTILRKREAYRRAFAGFDAETVAAWSEADVARLLADPGIVRNRLKIESTIRNARGVLKIGRSSALSMRTCGGSWTMRPGRTAGAAWPRCRPGRSSPMP